MTPELDSIRDRLRLLRQAAQVSAREQARQRRHLARLQRRWQEEAGMTDAEAAANLRRVLRDEDLR